MEAPNKSINSVISHQDVEVYLRIETYRAKIFKVAEKLVESVKWLPYSHRFDIIKESRILIHNGKQDYIIQREDTHRKVVERVRNRLIASGVADEKLLELIINLYSSHLAS